MAHISKATASNWQRLHSDTQGRLVHRANKTLSQRRIAASSYLDFAPARLLLDSLQPLSHPVEDVIYSLCVSYLRHTGIAHRTSVKSFLSTLPRYRLIDIKVPPGIWAGNDDVLGYIYQSLLTEGERNLTGQYYTRRGVVNDMLAGKVLADGETFLDPCCGSGAFLLSVKTNTPTCLFGFDINPVAVMIAGTNLLVKYARHDFVPHVYCLDFLLTDPSAHSGIPSTFDNVYTNPPWGADKTGLYAHQYPEIRSKERCAMVILQSLRHLSKQGVLYFLLPTSLLKIKAHRHIRQYILSHTTICKIDLFADRFDGVFTDFFGMKLKNEATATQHYQVTMGHRTTTIRLTEHDRAAARIAVEELAPIDRSVIHKMEACRNDDLKHSQWALGIVTGDNKTKVKKSWTNNLEPIYTGKEVEPFTLQKETSYILFEPAMFQQCAKTALYRAPEKLIYRFIAPYPIVAYDDQQRLCLNSANIVIPQLESISTKSTAALLNSTLYRYYYRVKFNDIKVLKGNLQQLPFPKLSPAVNQQLEDFVSDIHSLASVDNRQRQLDDIVYSIFNITPTEQQHIQSVVRPTTKSELRIKKQSPQPPQGGAIKPIDRGNNPTANGLHYSMIAKGEL